MRRRPARDLRTAIDCLPLQTRKAMLEGVEANRIIVGAYTDRNGGVCPMLAAHRNGGRTSLASFARAWDAYTGARRRRARPATGRELNTLKAMLGASIAVDELPGLEEVARDVRKRRVARTDELELRNHAVTRRPEQEPDPLGDVLGLDHLLLGHLALDPVGHRRRDEARAERRDLHAVARQLLVERLAQPDHAELGRRVGRQPALAVLAGVRCRVRHQRLAVLGARLLQHRDALTREQVHRAQVDVELKIELLRLRLRNRPTDPDAGVVDENVEPAAAVAVRRDELADLRLVGHVGGHGLDVEALAAQLLRGRFQLVRAPGRDRQPVAVRSERPGYGEPDAAGSSGYECRAVHSGGHSISLL